MKTAKEIHMETELEKLNQKFDSIINDINQKETEISILEEEIESLRNTQNQNTISSETYTDNLYSESEGSNRLYSQYRTMIRDYDGDKKAFVALYENVKAEEKNVLQLEKQLIRIRDKIDNSLRSIDRESKRKDKLNGIKDKCDFYRDKYSKLYEENDRIKELLNAILNQSKMVEKKLCSSEADDLIKKFNDVVKQRQKYDLEQLLIFKDINEILEEQHNIINNSIIE